jgi:hypothetical protein
VSASVPRSTATAGKTSPTGSGCTGAPTPAPAAADLDARHHPRAARADVVVERSPLLPSSDTLLYGTVPLGGSP